MINAFSAKVWAACSIELHRQSPELQLLKLFLYWLGKYVRKKML